jgi:hypothetical protein
MRVADKFLELVDHLTRCQHVEARQRSAAYSTVTADDQLDLSVGRQRKEVVILRVGTHLWNAGWIRSHLSSQLEGGDEQVDVREGDVPAELVSEQDLRQFLQQVGASDQDHRTGGHCLCHGERGAPRLRDERGDEDVRINNCPTGQDAGRFGHYAFGGDAIR